LGAGYDNFNPLPDSGNLGFGNGRQSIIFSLLAGLAAFRFILQALVVKEDLLANCPGKGLVAIDTGDRSISKFRRLLFNDHLRPVL
jgi:hypothetical protein